MILKECYWLHMMLYIDCYNTTETQEKLHQVGIDFSFSFMLVHHILLRHQRALGKLSLTKLKNISEKV